MKILNLYAGIGGNRKLWGDTHDITAVEFRDDIAAIYKDFFPNDNVIVGDAHEYLLRHYKEFDFIWSSPSCPTHSKARFWSSKGGIIIMATDSNKIVKCIIATPSQQKELVEHMLTDENIQSDILEIMSEYDSE